MAYLRLLSAELSALGLVCELRYLELPPLLRVRYGRTSVVGESVRAFPVMIAGLPVWWFRCSSGWLLAPCEDVLGSAAEVVGRLALFVPELAELAEQMRQATL